MSEYQSYEFRAIDRPLNAAAMEHLRSLSSRGTITPTSFSNEYHWGDFKGNPKRLIEHYFDLFVYWANWGTRWCLVKLPRGVVDEETLSRYLRGRSSTWWNAGENVVLQFLNEHDEAPWEYFGGETEWIDRLFGLRDELLQGDLRSLFITWLHIATWDLSPELGMVEPEDFDEPDAPVPPVPAGLQALTASQTSLADFLYLEPDILAAAAAHSPAGAPAEPDEAALRGWLAAQPADRKEVWLWRAATGQAPRLGLELRREFLRAAPSPVSESSLTLAELVAEAAAAQTAREREAAEKAERERLVKEREEAARREARMQAITGREDELWEQAEALAEQRQQAGYDEAVALLADLHELARRTGALSDFELRLLEYRDRHRRKTSLIRRLDDLSI